MMNKRHDHVLRDIDEMFDRIEGVSPDPGIPTEEGYHRGDRTQYKYLKPSTIDTFMTRVMGAKPVRIRDKFASSYQNEQNGQTYRCYKLPYRETMIEARVGLPRSGDTGLPESSFASGLKGKPPTRRSVRARGLHGVQLTRRWVRFRPTAVKASPAENRVRLSPPGRRRSVCHGGENDAAGCSLWIGLRGL